MHKHELTSEEKQDIEGPDFLNAEKHPERKFDYPEGLALAIELIKTGEAIPEIGRTERGIFKWLRVYKFDRATYHRKEVLFYTDSAVDNIGTFVKIFYQNGVEPEFKTVPE